MKGFSLACSAACALLTLSITDAQASAPAPWMGASHGTRISRSGQLQFDGNHERRSRATIDLGAGVYAPTPEVTPDLQPQIVVAPVYVPVEAQPAEAPGPGPHIIYVGREPPRGKPGAMPQVIYGDIPARASKGPEIIYGDSWR